MAFQLICSVVVTLNGKMGAKYAVSFPVLMRAIFGMYGSYFAIVIRSFVAAMLVCHPSDDIQSLTDVQVDCYSVRAGRRFSRQLHHRDLAII